MFKYEVGQVLENFKNHEEGVQFDISDDGATMIVFFNTPTQEEIEQFKSGKNFEIRFTTMYDVIMITTKIGNLNWMDAPYTPHLSKNLTKYQLPNTEQGLSLTLILVDANSGEIKQMRLLGLSERFTKNLFGCTMELKMKEFDKNNYANTLNKIFSTYDTKQLVKISSDYCKFN
ncbi:Uncharacterised protein [Tyzzerella nexilis]|uniref:Uncharacterized protein n=1 Tax=[Clostridium] nexile TaxID=29361 RepID=A0A6N2VSK2_9FIRM